MGTKVQFKSYIPMNNVIGNKNEHSSNSWSWFYQDNVLSGHLYDGSSLREANGYSLCDKEMLKRTMLEHEATFTKQVSELHRLYRIQKELMNELKNGEKLKLCSTFQTNIFASHMLSEASEVLQKMPHLSSHSCHSQIPVETSGSSIERNPSVPKTVNLPKKKFDLRLPAEAYIDIDDDEITKKPNKTFLVVSNPSSITCNAEGDNNVKLYVRSEADGSTKGSSRLCDLNEPLKLSSYEEGEVLSFVEVNGSKMEHEEIMRHQLHSDNFMGNLDKVDCFQRSSSSTNVSGEIRSSTNGSHAGLCNEEFSVISQPVNNKSQICDEFVLPERSKNDNWIGEMPSRDNETSKGTSKLPNLNSSEFAALQFSNFSCSVNSTISTPSISYSINPNGMIHTRTAVQLLRSFDFYAANNCSEKSSQNNCSEGLLYASVKQSVEPSWLRKKPAQSNSADIEQSASQLKDELPSSLSKKNMDLEGLCDTKVEQSITATEEESKELNFNLIISDKEDDLHLTDGSHETLIREAANHLVAMSLVIGDDLRSHDLTRSSIPTSFDNLLWFADFVTSTEASTGISRAKSPHHVDDDGFDMFEYMTLKLKETKENEFLYKLQENQNHSYTSTSLLPPMRSRRESARKKRQRRDFQKDILPGLSSLSWHEISEDIQSFEGIMRASGKPRKTGLSRRSMSQKASNWRARGRRRRRSLAITVTEVKACSLQKGEENSTAGISIKSILGWGRTTRRCRRPRLLPGSLSVSLA